MAKDGLAAPITAGFASGFVLIFAIILISAATHEKDVSIYSVIHQKLLSGITIGKATIEVRSVPEFGMTTGYPICRNQLSDQQVGSSMLGSILANASSNGERKTYRITSDNFIPIAKTLCVTKAWIRENEKLDTPLYPGWISVQSNNGMATHKYWYGINIYWNNTTEKSRYAPVGFDYKGPMPKYEKVKVYIFASRSDFYDENLLSDIQARAVNFHPITLEPFGATPAGIVNRYNFTLVVPHGTEIYIDKDLKKPDGSLVTLKDLYPDSDLGTDFSQGSIPAQYDYEYVQVPAIWFTVDASNAKVVDSHLAMIKHVIEEETSKCMQFRKEHAGSEGRPCPN